MIGALFSSITPEEYEHLLRALIVYDEVRATSGGGRGISPVQEKWFAEGERLGIPVAVGDRDAYAATVLEELEQAFEHETWESIAWWIAEREAKRRSGRSRDRDAEEVIVHRYYHEIMEELDRHGIDHLAFSDLALTKLSPGVVRSALEQYRSHPRLE